MQFDASGRNIVPRLYRFEVVMAAITPFRGPKSLFAIRTTVDGDYGAFIHFTTPTNTAANCFGRSMCA